MKSTTKDELMSYVCNSNITSLQHRFLPNFFDSKTIVLLRLLTKELVLTKFT